MAIRMASVAHHTSGAERGGRQVLEVVAGYREEDPDTIVDACYRNTLRVFFPDEAGTS